MQNEKCVTRYIIKEVTSNKQSNTKNNFFSGSNKDFLQNRMGALSSYQLISTNLFLRR